MNNDHPTWLKAMQNGSLGEARSKAFLLDRFWVLERSVDIDGADFIIQRRLTQKNILDKEAPRLGVVQVKFFGSQATTHYVHKNYVLDEGGNARGEFFLLCHTGDEENQRIFLLNSHDIKEDFHASQVAGNEKYKISYVDIFKSRKFEVTNRKNALDRIERQLEIADFLQNRRFLSWMLSDANHDLTAILPIYREPIDTGFGNLQETFEYIKKIAKKAASNVEEMHDKFVELMSEPDPLVAADIIDEITAHCRDGLGRWSIRLPEGLDNEEFFSACRQHKAMIDRLKQDGLLDAFLDLKRNMRANVLEFLKLYFPFKYSIAHSFTLIYDPGTLSINGLHSEIIPAEDVENSYSHVKFPSEYSRILESKPGYIKYFWLPGRFRYGSSRTLDDISEMHEKVDFYLNRECMNRVFELRYGELP